MKVPKKPQNEKNIKAKCKTIHSLTLNQFIIKNGNF